MGLNTDQENQLIVERLSGRWVIPDDLLDSLIGYDELKFEILDTLRSGVRNHMLFEGPPGSGKTLIMMLLEGLPGAVTIGPDTTISGLRALFERGPKLVLVNELEKFKNPEVIDVMLDWLDWGRWVITIKDRQEVLYNDATFFFAINDARYIRGKSAAPFLTRVDRFYLDEYSRSDFEDVVVSILTSRYNRGKALSQYIAEVSWDHFGNNIRQAVRIGALCHTKDRVRRKINAMMIHTPPGA